jgi:hypothetical protein
MMLKSALVLCAVLAPLSMGLAADDEETTKLHNNPYQETVQVDTCVAPGDCHILFPATDHVTTVVTAVSCNFSTPNGTKFYYVSLGTKNAVPAFYLQPFYYYNDSFSTVWGINGQSNLFINKHDQPSLILYTFDGAANNVKCTISGYHS